MTLGESRGSYLRLRSLGRLDLVVPRTVSSPSLRRPVRSSDIFKVFRPEVSLEKVVDDGRSLRGSLWVANVLWVVQGPSSWVVPDTTTVSLTSTSGPVKAETVDTELDSGFVLDLRDVGNPLPPSPSWGTSWGEDTPKPP